MTILIFRFTILLTLLILLATSAYADTLTFQWTLYTDNADGFRLYMDTGSVTATSMTEVCLDIDLTLTTQTYYMTLMSGDGFMDYTVLSGAGFVARYNNTVTYPTFPSTLPSAIGSTLAPSSIRLKNSEGTVILGPSSLTSYTDTQGFNDDVMHWRLAGDAYTEQ